MCINRITLAVLRNTYKYFPVWSSNPVGRSFHILNACFVPLNSLQYEVGLFDCTPVILVKLILCKAIVMYSLTSISQTGKGFQISLEVTKREAWSKSHHLLSVIITNKQDL